MNLPLVLTRCSTVYLTGNYVERVSDFDQEPSDDEFDSDSEAGYDLRDVSSDVEMHPDDLDEESDARYVFLPLPLTVYLPDFAAASKRLGTRSPPRPRSALSKKLARRRARSKRVPTARPFLLRETNKSPRRRTRKKRRVRRVNKRPRRKRRRRKRRRQSKSPPPEESSTRTQRLALAPKQRRETPCL